jgi:preprotein translocase subunit SecD
VMLAGVLGRYAFQPGNWHKGFKVGLGLDLSSGTSVVLKAVAPHGQKPSSGEINKAVQIMLNRVDAAGFSGASVVPAGGSQITVSVPGQGAEKVVNLVGTTALLRFRQVLLVAPNTTSSAPTPTASASPSPSASGSSKAKSGSSSSPSPSASSSAGKGQAVSASQLGAKSTPSPSSSPSPSDSASTGASPSPSASPTGKPVLSTTADGIGDASLLAKTTVTDFDKLNCSNKKWQTQLYGDYPPNWDNPKAQIVSCYGGNKYALATAPVTGQDLHGVSAQVAPSGEPGWVIVFKASGAGAKALGTLTTQMYTKYTSTKPTVDEPAYYLSQLAIVLDGKIVGQPPQIDSVITTSGQISGPSGTGFSQGQATYLANVLKYGALPLSFQKQSISTVSASLGSAQLSAGLIAGAVGLVLVVVYSFLYYRGLAVVSVSSLAIAAAIAYMAIVLLSKYYGLTLDLAGVAGLIVAIGITADSFVVFFERLRDEVRDGRSLRAAVERGWTRARRTILVSDTVSFLAAALLYYFAIGDVKGFAFTLGLTTIIDVVVVFLFTKPMVTLLARTKFYGQGHKLSGLDPARLGMRSPWRGSRRPARPAAGTTLASRPSSSPREA